MILLLHNQRRIFHLTTSIYEDWNFEHFKAAFAGFKGLLQLNMTQNSQVFGIFPNNKRT
jgi:hypothetical protein